MYSENLLPTDNSIAAPPPPFAVKVEFNNDLRRFPFASPQEVAFAALKDRVCESFALDPRTTSFFLKYKDEEGDLVSVSTSSELREAIQLMQGHFGVPRFYLQTASLPPPIAHVVPSPSVCPQSPKNQRSKVPVIEHEEGLNVADHLVLKDELKEEWMKAKTEKKLAKKQRKAEKRLFKERALNSLLALDPKDLKKLAKTEKKHKKGDKKDKKSEKKKAKKEQKRSSKNESKEKHDLAKASVQEEKKTHKELKAQAKEAKRKSKLEKRTKKVAALREAPPQDPSESDSERYVQKLQKYNAKLDKAKQKHAKLEAKQLRARFVAHVSVPNGTVVAPSETFLKVWRIRNDGAIAWPEGTRFVFLPKSDSLGGPSELVFEKSVQVGQEIEVSLQLTAPEKDGLYEGRWRFLTPEGFKFGKRMSASIHVQKEDPFLCGSRGVSTLSGRDNDLMADFEKVEG